MIQEYYAVKNKNNDIRKKSSSGGTFYSIAYEFLKNGGVVYGAIYDENNNVVHSRIEKSEDLIKLCGSKYVKSDMKNCFNEIIDDLTVGNKVLFSGTPCQVAAVKKMASIKKKDSNLFLIDVVCHGSPQQKYYYDYKKYMEHKYKSSIKKINMRFKSDSKFDKKLHQKHYYNGPVGEHVMKIWFDNKKTYTMVSDYDPYYSLFDYFLLNNCYDCQYANLNRNSDLTIGDFHEFSSRLNEFNDGNGVSLVIINSLKGKELFNKDNYLVESKTKEMVIQPALSKPAKKPLNYDDFLNDYEKCGFKKVAKKYSKHGVKYTIKKFLVLSGLYDKLKRIKR